MAFQNERKLMGIVVQDKAAGSREILVYPQDTLPFGSGELKPVANKVSVSLADKNQGTAVGEVTETNVITATYYGNEMSDMPPDVVKGESVELIVDGDTHTVYWKSTGRTAKNRSRERKEIRVANQEGYDKNVDDGNAYFIRIDTLTSKEIRIQTCMSDGEKFAYTIVINPAESKLSLSDNHNNEIVIESLEKKIYIRNEDNCILNMEKKNILLGAVEDLVLKADRQIVLNTPNVTNQNDSGDGCTVFKAKAMQFETTESMVVKSPNGIGLHGPVEAHTVVSGSIQAEDYSTGKY